MNFTLKNAGIICQNQRSMATLKDIGLRLQSVKNIQKITASMKMVAAAKYNKAERDLKPARPYGHASNEFYGHLTPASGDAATPAAASATPHVVVALTSDRGLCGAANSTVVKAVREWISQNPAAASNLKVVAVGDKSRAMFQRQLSDRIFCHVTNIGKLPPSFADASKIAEAIVQAATAATSAGDAASSAGDAPIQATLFYNRFKNMIQYNTVQQRVTPSFDSLAAAPTSLFKYDSVDEDVLRGFSEFQLAASVYAGLKEAACSEQSARMTAMESASKNAGEMIDKLTLTFNRTRQAAITRELSEIVSGASAV